MNLVRASLLVMAIKQLEKSMMPKIVISIISQFNSTLNLLPNYLIYLSIIISSVILSEWPLAIVC